LKETQGQRGSPWKDGFLFVGNLLVLDFINTRPVIDGEPMELLSDLGAVLRWYVAAGLLSLRQANELRKKWGNSATGRAAVKVLQAWREQLRSALITWETGREVPKSAVKRLNRLMADYPVLTRLTLNGRKLASESWFRPQTPEGLIAPVARSAAMLFTTVDRNRVRVCGNCVLHFVDTSKKGTRRWCSMELCGNRLKVAAYTARRRNARS